MKKHASELLKDVQADDAVSDEVRRLCEVTVNNKGHFEDADLARFLLQITGLPFDTDSETLGVHHYRIIKGVVRADANMSRKDAGFLWRLCLLVEDGLLHDPDAHVDPKVALPIPVIGVDYNNELVRGYLVPTSTGGPVGIRVDSDDATFARFNTVRVEV